MFPANKVAQGEDYKTPLLDLMEVAPGAKFGAWTVLMPVGIGGMSEVYLASRTLESGEQRVALKLLAIGMSRADALARFKQETVILAQLNDARIVRLIDAGYADHGRPWLAMEYVEGEPIDLGCDRRGFTIRQRIERLIEVARAVDHAHRHLVVHHDIKPGNVLLCNDGQDIRLLDFGIAKVLEPTDPERTSAPTGAFTLDFASPEQLSVKPTSIASDIYQLGQLLYLLLTGLRPFRGAEESPAKNLLAMRQGALRPSLTVRDGNDESHLARCGMRAQELARTLRGDLDIIALKALEFEPQRRYLSARELAEDLRRWLDRDPILARPDSLYRLRKRLRKYWLASAAATAALVLLIAYTVGVALQRHELLEEKERIGRILDAVTDMFLESGPFLDDAAPATVKQVVEETSQRFLVQSNDDPEFQVLMLERLASLQATLRNFSVMKRLLGRALAITDINGLSDKVRAGIIFSFASAQYGAGELASAEKTLQQNNALLSDMEPPWPDLLHARILLQRDDLGAADRGLTAVLARMDESAATPLFLITLHNFTGSLRREQGALDAALNAYELGLSISLQNASLQRNWRLIIRSNIADALMSARRYRESDQVHRSLLAWASQQLGESHPALEVKVINYSSLLFQTLRFHTANQLLRRHDGASAEQDTLFRALYLKSRAWASLAAGQELEAIEFAIKAAEKAASTYGTTSPMMRSFTEQLAWILFEFGAYSDAFSFARAIEFDADRELNMARLVLALSTGFGATDSASVQHSLYLKTDPCFDVYHDALWGTLVRRRAISELQLPATCDGYLAALVHDLGAHWTPDWEGVFAPEPYASPLLRRLRAKPPLPDWRPSPNQRERMDTLLSSLREPRRVAP